MALAGACMPLWADVYDRAQLDKELARRRGTPTNQPAPAVSPAPVVSVPVAPSLPVTKPRPPAPALSMMSEDKYRATPQPPNVRTVSVAKVMCWGLGRGFCNITLWPGEFVRGFSYEFSAREWYVAMGTSWLAAFGGGISRCCAGMADVFTCGYFGDIALAKGYPDFVWQGDWLYYSTSTFRTRETSMGDERMRRPETDIKPGAVRPR